VRFSNIRNKDNPSLNGQDKNLREELRSPKDKSKDLRPSNLNTLNVEKKLREGRENTKSKMTRGSKSWPL
jgi:hypothetical protein